jgi:hypothetical protein
MTSAVELLERLIHCANHREDASPILHERVVLERLDGEVLRGREVVVDAVTTREGGAVLRVLSREEPDALHVALEHAEVPGHLRFVLRGVAHHGVLLAIVMEG